MSVWLYAAVGATSLPALARLSASSAMVTRCGGGGAGSAATSPAGRPVVLAAVARASEWWSGDWEWKPWVRLWGTMAAWGVRTAEGRGSGDRQRASRAPMPEAADTVDLRIVDGTGEGCRLARRRKRLGRDQAAEGMVKTSVKFPMEGGSARKEDGKINDAR